MKLRNKDRNSLTTIFETAPINFEIWAYGSRVNGNAHDGSDLDLVMRSSTLEKIPLPIFKDLQEKIRNSNIPIVVELFDWARLPENFHKNIFINYEVLYKNENC